MKTVTGDLITLALEGEFDVIIHGCNCYNTMGAGIARAVRDRLPEAFAADRATIKGDFEKLGTYTSAEIVRDDVRFTVINAYTQGNYRGSGALVDYDAIRSNFRAVAKNFPNARIGYPKIGAGLAGATGTGSPPSSTRNSRAATTRWWCFPDQLAGRVTAPWRRNPRRRPAWS